MSKNIVVIGSSNTDMIIKLKQIPKPGETVIGGKFSTASGGKGANQAVAAVRAGGKVVFIGKIGKDMFGERIINGFKSYGLKTNNIIKDENEPSGVALIFVDDKGENSIAVASGANAFLSPENINDKADIISKAETLLLQLETPIETVETAVRIAAENKIKVILNPAPARKLSKALLKNISIITPNETEAELLTGISIKNQSDVENAAIKLKEFGVETVIITLGSKGSFVLSKTFTSIVPAFPVKAVDTTAAGDVFNGALVVALSEKKELEEAVVFASAAAALAVTKLGAQTSAPSIEEIEKMLKK
jgi:ribokinase